MPHATNNETNKMKATGTGHFPSRVMAVLNEEEVQQTMHWLPDGKAFIVCNTPQFAKTVLKKHFKGIQLHSFTKSLSQWGFDKKGEKNIGGRCISYTFSSPLFLRDQPELCSMMIRMAKKDWKASRAPRRKSAQSQPAPSQSNSEPEQPEPEKPDQPEQQYDIPQAQPLLSHIHLPVMMSFVPVPVWPTQAQAINLLGRSHRPVPSQRPFPQMTHQLAPTQLNYASRQVALARDIIDRQLLETARLHVPPMMHQLATTQPKFASGHVPLARDIINKPLETASRRIPPMMHQFAPNQPNYDNGHLPLARDIIDSKPLEKSGSFNKPQPRKEMVTIRKQNTKASLLKSELNAAIAMSMLDGKDRE